MSLNTVCWADIPVKNLDRSIAFYSAVLGSEVSKEGEGDFTFGLLPHSEQNASGCLVERMTEPSQKGPLVYLSAEGRLDPAIGAVAKNDCSCRCLSGRILFTKEAIWRLISGDAVAPMYSPPNIPLGRMASAPSLSIQKGIKSHSIRIAH